MTRFEMIAAALPLHAQRIAELTYNKQWLAQSADAFDTIHGAGAVLRTAFVWAPTSEGFEYWERLSGSHFR